MPNETPELLPRDVDRILTDWQDDSYLGQLSEQEAADESDRITERMLEISDGISRKREAESNDRSASINFEELQPDVVRARESFRRLEADRVWDQLDRNPRLTSSDKGELLEKKGLGEVAERDGEVVSHESDREIMETSERDRRNTAKHASEVHHGPKRSTTTWRPKGSIQRDIVDNDEKVRTERQLNGGI